MPAKQSSIAPVRSLPAEMVFSLSIFSCSSISVSLVYSYIYTNLTSYLDLEVAVEALFKPQLTRRCRACHYAQRASFLGDEAIDSKRIGLDEITGPRKAQISSSITWSRSASVLVGLGDRQEREARWWPSCLILRQHYRITILNLRVERRHMQSTGTHSMQRENDGLCERYPAVPHICNIAPV